MYHACVYRITSLQQSLKATWTAKIDCFREVADFLGFHQQAFSLASDCKANFYAGIRLLSDKSDNADINILCKPYIYNIQSSR